MERMRFIKTACGVPVVSLADPMTNAERIIALCEEAYEKQVGVILFPELSLTGYTCGDLFFQQLLLDGTAKALKNILSWSENKRMVIVIGVALTLDDGLYNCAVVINNGIILGAVPKSHVPDDGAVNEKRWFTPGSALSRSEVTFGGQTFPIGTDLLFRMKEWPEFVFGIEIGEDLFAPISPSIFESAAGAVMIFNPAAGNALIGRSAACHEWVKQQALRCNGAYCYCASGFGESTTDMAFGGDAFIYEKGTLLAESSLYEQESQLIIGDVDVEMLLQDRRKKTSCAAMTGKVLFRDILFSMDLPEKLDRQIDPSPFIPNDPVKRYQRCEEILTLQTMGLVGRLTHIGNPTMVLGISGGLDSTLALLVCVRACDVMGVGRDKIHAVTMPGFGTTDRTYDNAVNLIKRLGASFHEISVKDACIQHFVDIGHDMAKHDVTYENAQARERTQILMDLANKYNGLVVGTGDLSELALGWATYNGDHMSMYGVNAGIPKTLVRHLVAHVAENCENESIKTILMDVFDTPVSPELLPPDESGNIAQKTEDLVGPYELHDFFIFHALRHGFSPKKIFFMAQKAFENKYDDQTIYKWLRSFYWRFFTQQFKRSCLPDGPKVGSVGLSPRGDWRMPSDAKVQLWLHEMDEIALTMK